MTIETLLCFCYACFAAVRLCLRNQHSFLLSLSFNDQIIFKYGNGYLQVITVAVSCWVLSALKRVDFVASFIVNLTASTYSKHHKPDPDDANTLPWFTFWLVGQLHDVVQSMGLWLPPFHSGFNFPSHGWRICLIWTYICLIKWPNYYKTWLQSTTDSYIDYTAICYTDHHSYPLQIKFATLEICCILKVLYTLYRKMNQCIWQTMLCQSLLPPRWYLAIIIRFVKHVSFACYLIHTSSYYSIHLIYLI